MVVVSGAVPTGIVLQIQLAGRCLEANQQSHSIRFGFVKMLINLAFLVLFDRIQTLWFTKVRL